MAKTIDKVSDIIILIVLIILVEIELIPIAEFILGVILLFIYHEIKFWRGILEIIINALEENDNEIN